MIWIRRFVFYLFLLAYLIVCPLTILYALGFYFKPGSEHGIVKTGLIYISTVPSGATVYLNGSRYQDRTPSVLRHLMPGYYTVRVEAKGYRPWSEEVPVEAEKASVMEKLVLLPQSLPKESCLTQSFDTLHAIPRTPLVFLTKDRRISGAGFWDLRRQEWAPLTEWLPDPALDRIARWFSVPKSESLVLETRAGDASRYFQLDLKNPGRVRELTSLFREPPEKLLWEAGWEEHLIAGRGDTLDYLRTDKMLIYPQAAVGVRGAGVFDHSVYLLRKDHTLSVASYDGKSERPLLRDAYLGQVLFGDEAPFQVDPVENDLILFLGPRGRLLSNRLPHLFAPEGIRGYEVDRDGKRIVVWTASQIGIIEMETEKEFGEIFERGPHIVWVFKEGQDLRQAFWIYHGAHVIFRDESRLFFLDLETFSRAAVYPLTEVRKNTEAAYWDPSGTLYFLDAGTGALVKAEILPVRELNLIPFPMRREKPVQRKMMRS